MINWKNLEKFIAPGKVVTLVMLIDGEEVGAFSFNVDSLAFKEALEAASHLDPVKVADKKTEPAKSTKLKVEKAAKPTEAELSKIDIDPEPLDEEDDGVDEVAELDKIFIPDKPMTREQIMSQMDKVSTELEKPVEQKPPQQQMQLTDEW